MHVPKYPFITMCIDCNWEYNQQFIIEGCCVNNNFKAVISKDNLFDEYSIDMIYIEKNNLRPELCNFFNIDNFLKEIPKEEVIKLYFYLTNNILAK